MLSIDEIKNLKAANETKLAQYLGLPVETLKAMRFTDLAEGQHFNLKGKGVEYTSEGIKRLLELTGEHVNVIPGYEYSVKIKRLPVNPYMLIGTLSDGQEVRVKVKTQTNFMQGMLVTAKAEYGTPVLCFSGTYPRIRGKA